MTDHPLKSRSNSPLVPNHIVTTSKSGGVFSTGEAESQSMGSHSSLTTINTASLLQSAARSVLDSVYTPTSTNVSDDEDDENDDMARERRKEQQAGRPTLESLKKEALPAMPDEQDRKRFVGCLAAVLASAYDYDVEHEEDRSQAAESYAYLNRTEQGHDGDDEEEQYGDNSYSTEGAAATSTESGEAWDTSFAENDDEPYLSNACSTSFEYSDISQLPGIAESEQPQRHTHQQPSPKNDSQRKKSTKARNRHRKRRYDLLSKLLLSSAELLLLDKSQARAFLPMLARLLMPPSAAQKTNEFRIRQQKLQERQQQQDHADQDGSTACNTVDNTPSNSSLHSSAYDSPERKNATQKDKGVNHYHFSPKTGMPVSREIPLPENEDCSFLPYGLDEEDHLRPFLESLSPGAGFRCLSLLLLQYLLHSAEGYDARIRHVIKKLGVIVLLHDMEMARELELLEEEEESRRIQHSTAKRSKHEDLVAAATRKFEGLEHSIAVRLIRLSKEQQRLQQAENPNTNKSSRQRKRSSRSSDASSLALSREQFVRGLKIGSAGLVAGTIFAVTGGLAAPGIAAGMAAIAGSTAATAAVAAIVSSTPAVTAIFGVGGGSLAAYKMNRRTQGLTEFEFRRQDKPMEDKNCQPEEVEEAQAELFSTVCISGWLRDQHDFQRPWGINPSNPRIRDRLELLERFYAVYKPDHVSKCKNLLQKWKGEEKQLWELLKQKYGRDPDHLFPIVSPNHSRFFHLGLTLEQDEVLNELFVELGYVADIQDLVRKHIGTKTTNACAFDNARQNAKQPFLNQHCEKNHFTFSSNHDAPCSTTSALLDEAFPRSADGLSCASSGFDSVASSYVASTAGASKQTEGNEEEKGLPKHISTVWDYHSRFGGEVYTVKWESEMLIEVCGSVQDFAFDLINGATAQLLRQTALHTLLNAMAVPYALVNAANMIDGSWTLVVERADEAGKELARSLLFSRAGHRPVTLVGFSFGARAIYSCLKELAKYQEKWEASREASKSYVVGYCSEGEPGQGKDHYAWTMREPASIVEDAIMMGLPNHLSLGSWRACRQVVGGRLVNCYSRKDMILSLMFQIKRLAGALRPVCGTCSVDVAGVENVDVSDLISGHEDYCLVTGEILKRVRHGQPFRSSASFISDVNGALVVAQ